MSSTRMAVHRLGGLSVHQDMGRQQRIGSSVLRHLHVLIATGRGRLLKCSSRVASGHVTDHAVQVSAELKRISLWKGVFISRACLPIRRSRKDGPFDSVFTVVFSHCPKQHSLHEARK